LRSLAAGARAGEIYGDSACKVEIGRLLSAIDRSFDAINRARADVHYGGRMNQIIRELKRQAAGQKLAPEELKALIRAGYVYRNGDDRQGPRGSGLARRPAGGIAHWLTTIRQ
jgi:hypothetical protein